MRRKAVLFSVLAVASLMLLVAVSAVTVFALVGDGVMPDTESVEAVPVQAETVTQPQVEEPVHKYEQAGYEGWGGCSKSKARLQMTEAPANERTVEDQLLTQVLE